MSTRMLGRSRIEVSALGMGCWAIGGPWVIEVDGAMRQAGWGNVDDAESIRAIRAALDAGITLFDTAPNYGCGHSERILGKALGTRRREAVIATKFGHIVDEVSKVVRGDNDAILSNLQQDCENSLQRLGTDYIDLYQLHEGSLDIEQAIPIREALDGLVRQGKIRAYGWSTDLVDRAAVFAQGRGCASIQFSLNALSDNADMIALCEQHDVAGINKKPLASGFLTGKFTSETIFPENDYRQAIDFSSPRFANMLALADGLQEILESNGRTMAQGAIAWIWARSGISIPIPGARTAQQAVSNAASLIKGPLTPEELQQANHVIAQLHDHERAQT